MKSKEERFNEWRQEKAKSEQAYIKTVPLVEEYIKSFDTLAELRSDVANPDSEKIKKWTLIKGALWVFYSMPN